MGMAFLHDQLPASPRRRWLPLLTLTAIACTGQVGGGEPGGANAGAGSGTAVGPGKPGSGSPGPTTPGGGSAPSTDACRNRPILGRTPLRRLTRYEYNNTVRDLLGDDTLPANALPAEESGNGFGNDARAQAVSSLLAEQYAKVAEDIARRATASPEALRALEPCAGQSPGLAQEEPCARGVIERWAPRAFRRPLSAEEAEVLMALYRSSRTLPGATFTSAVAAVIEAVLQSPDFLYRIEEGIPDRTRPGWLRPTGYEMATRLSYLLWGTMPDESLRVAADSGELDGAEGVQTHASRMLADPRTRATFRFFTGNLLPIGGLTDLERDETLYPSFAPAIGALMRQETERLLEHEIFEGSGTWSAALTAPFTFANRTLAEFYGMGGVTGNSFQKVALDTDQRLGLLTHGSVLAGTTHSNHTNPVVRGSFVVQKLLCIPIPLPDASLAEKIKPPDPYGGKTARERFTQHQQDAACRTCHALMDPVGFALENFDAVGLYRGLENGVPIDATGALPGVDGPIAGPVALARALAEHPAAQGCFATHLVQFSLGKTLGPDDACLVAEVEAAFAAADHDVRRLLVALTQTEAFLYLAGPGGEGS